MGQLMNTVSASTRARLLALVFLLQAGGMLGMLFVRSATQVALYAVFYGLLMGSQQSLMMPIYAELFGLQHLGKVQGVAFGMALFTAGLGPMVFGACKDNLGSYRTPIMGTSALTACASVSLLVLSFTDMRPKLSKAASKAL